VALFRAGHDEAFRVIHDRYRQRLFAYARQMLPGRQDAEDALQDVFVRAYSNLRANDRELALRAWLYRVAHNRCVDELRRPAPPPPETMQFICSPIQDPIAQADQRESLRRLVEDVRRLPAQQRSALLMRELGGMPYADLADALGVSVPAVKSLLVRARMALAQAVAARETACADIREELIVAHDRRTRPNANARRHLRDCPGCRQFRGEMRGMSRQLAALTPALGPLGVAAKVLGLGGGAGGGAAASSGAAAAAGSGSAIVSAGALATGAGHVATLIAATVVTAGGAVEIQRTIVDPPPAHHHHRVHHARAAAPSPASSVAAVQLSSGTGSTAVAAPAPAVAYSPPAASSASASASSSAAVGTPLKAITGKAVKKVSSAVSATTKDATKQLTTATKVTDAGGKTTSSTGASATLGGTAPASTTATGTGTGTGTGSPGASTSTSSGTTSGGGSGTSSSGTTSPSSDGSTPASAAGAPGSAAAGSSTSGTSATGSSTS
jgi:RNA polymerase sigma factor (sigma-70 family)